MATLPELSKDEILRYSRHLILPEVGMDGQRKLKAAKVLLVGTGGLGAPTALYLAAAGIGTIGVVDFDVVESSNLQRQIVHGNSTLGMSKVASAKQRLQDLNSHIQIMQTYGVAYDVINSGGIGSADFGQYDKILTTGQQPDNYYYAIQSNVAKFETYMSEGGCCSFEVANYFELQFTRY